MADVKEWGARFNFPENLKIEYDGYSGGISNQIAVKMAEKYDDFIVSQIAMEARVDLFLTVVERCNIHPIGCRCLRCPNRRRENNNGNTKMWKFVGMLRWRMR